MRMLKNKLAVIGALVLAASASMVTAEESGKSEFMNACATCHGVDGVGDGPMAEFMSTKVPDLTQLSAANDGVFPMLKVIHVMDGRTGLRGHGSEMPVWGDIFKEEAGGVGKYGTELAARGRLLSIAYYIETIQK